MPPRIQVWPLRAQVLVPTDTGTRTDIIMACPAATSDIAYSLEHFKNHTTKDQAIIAELYEGISPGLQATLAEDNRCPKFKYIVSLLHVPAFHLMNVKLFADNSTNYEKQHKQERINSVPCARDVAADVLLLSPIHFHKTFDCDAEGTKTRKLLCWPSEQEYPTHWFPVFFPDGIRNAAMINCTDDLALVCPFRCDLP